MSGEDRREVYRALREAQGRLTYFLLGAVGAAIGFAVTQTQTAKLGWGHSLLGIAVLSWSASFFFGCRHLQYVSSTLYANATLLQVKAGEHPEVGTHPQLMRAASEGISAALETNNDRANRYGDWQFRFLVGGSVAFIGWHVWQMYLRSL